MILRLTLILALCSTLLHCGNAIEGEDPGCFMVSDFLKRLVYFPMETGSADIVNLPPGAETAPKYPDGHNCFTGVKAVDRATAIEAYAERIERDEYEWEMVRKCEGSLPRPNMKIINQRINDLFGRRCRSGICHFHIEEPDIVCRSSSIQAIFGMIFAFILAVLWLY